MLDRTKPPIDWQPPTFACPLPRSFMKKGYAKETCEAIFGEIKALQEVPLSSKELLSHQEALRGYLIGLCDNKGTLANVYADYHLKGIPFTFIEG